MTTLAFDIVGNDKSGSKAIEGVGEAAEKTGKKFNIFKANAIAQFAATGLEAGQAFGAALMKATSAEAANDKLAAQLGFSGEIAKEFGTIAGDLYSNAYGDSLEGVNEALRAVWQNGLIDEDAATEDIKQVAATALDFASAMGQDIGQVSSAIGQMLKTGMAKNATEAFDIMTRGFQQGLNKADDLLDTFNEYSTQFRKLGIDGQTAMGLISQGLQAGARDADIVADALKEFSIRAIDGSKTTEDAYKALGLNAKKMAADIAAGGPKASEALQVVLDRLRAMKNPVDQSAAAVGLFGTQAEDLGKALFALDPKQAVNALGDVAGASKKMGETLADNAQTRMTMFTRSLETGFINFLGGKVIPAIEKAVTWLQQHFGPQLRAIGQIIQSIAVPAIIALGIAVLIAGAQMLAGWLMGLGPIALIVAAVVGLTALIVANWQRILEFLTGVWEAIKNAAKAVVDFLIGIWESYVGFYVGIWNKIRELGSTIWDGAKSAVVAAKNWIVDRWNDVVSWVAGIPGKIGQALGGLGRVIGDAFKGAFNVGIDAINFFIDRANDAIYGVNVINPFSDIPYLPHIRRLHSGGIVPGFPGSERLTVLEAGETVLPADSKVATAPAVIQVKFNGDVDSAFATAFMSLVRRGVIQIG